MDSDRTFNNGGHDSSFNEILGNDEAFEHFFKDQFITLCAYCQAKFGFDADQAKEAVHTAFIKLWKTRHTLPASISVKAYLYRIIINNCLDLLKHEQIKMKYEKLILQQHSLSQLTRDAENFDLKILKSDIDKAVAEMPGQMRRIFELSRYEGMKYAEIARHLDISVNTVETQMTRALARLRIKLARYLPLWLALLAMKALT